MARVGPVLAFEASCDVVMDALEQRMRDEDPRLVGRVAVLLAPRDGLTLVRLDDVDARLFDDGDAARGDDARAFVSSLCAAVACNGWVVEAAASDASPFPVSPPCTAFDAHGRPRDAAIDDDDARATTAAFVAIARRFEQAPLLRA